MDKVEEQTPNAKKQTVSMLCRAENRTLMALLNAKSPAQTKQVLEAAYKRAGLRSPWDEAAPVVENGSHENMQMQMQHIDNLDTKMEARFEQIQVLIANQITTTANIAGALACIPSMQHHQHLADMLEQIQHTNLEAMGVVMKRLAEMESRIGIWETAILPHILDRLPHNAPGTPIDHSAPSGEEDQEVASTVRVDSQATPRVTAIDLPSAMSALSSESQPDLTERVLEELQPTMLASLEDRSLRTQATKVVSSALYPLRAPK